MKHRSPSKWILGASLAVFSLAAARMQSVASEPTLAAPAGTALTAEEISPTNAVALDQGTPSAADTDAPVKPVANDKPLPSNIRPSGPVAEVIKLANSGLNESVMLAFVTNSAHTFNLSAEDIIYLNDIGVPGSVVTAMIQQDQALKTSLAAALSAPPAAFQGPGGPPPREMEQPPNGAPGPDQVAPQAADAGSPYPAEAPLAPPDASVPMFYDALSPYGNWVDVQGYGRCWQPSAAVINTGWQPYFDCGHWIYSDCGWYWLSDYSWGWAPFHYGSWFRHGRLGWCWVPGHVWGPSWVCWRYNNDYCGWAPLPPGAGFVAGIGLTFHGHSVWDRDDFGLRPNHYHFVAWNHFQDRQLRPHGLPPHDVARVYNTATVGTRIIGDGQTVINNGLPPSRVAAATHRTIHTVALRQMSDPTTGGGRAEHFEAGGQALAVYRPNLQTVTSQSASSRSLPGPGTSATPWMPRSETSRQSVTELRQDNPPPGSAAPLILRGQQPSVLRESPPANSLVLIGRGNSARPAAPAQPWSSAPSAAKAASAVAGPIAGTDDPDREEVPRAQSTVNRARNEQAAQRNWMGTVSSSPQPSWFERNEPVPLRQPESAAVPRPEPRTYQAVPRTYSPEVPRYAPAPAYTPQRSAEPTWSAPARSPSFEARPAPSAPSAPSAPPAVSHSSPSPPQQSSSRNGR
jgi:hypothetical protein